MIAGETFPVEPWQLRETRLDLELLAAVRVAVRAVQRPHRAARQPRRGRAVRAARHLPRLVLRDPAAARTPRPGSATPRTARPSSTSPTARSSGCWSTTSRSTCATASCSSTSASSTCAPARCAATAALALARRPAGRGRARPGWSRSTHRSVAAHRVRGRGGRRVHPRHGAVRAGRQRGPAAAVARTRGWPPRWPRPLEAVQHEHAEQRRGAACTAPARSDLMMAAGDGPRRSRCPGRVEVETDAGDGLGAHHGDLPGCGPGSRLRIVKYLAYGWSSLRVAARAARPGRRRADRRALQPAGTACWTDQRAYLDDFWDGADVEVEGDPDIQQAVRFGLFHVLQASARAERRAIAGKGLTGPGYDGHAFWDTEAFVLPVLTYTAAARRGRRPALARLDPRPGPGARSAARPGGRGVPLAHHPRRRSARRTGRPAPPPGT